MTNPREAPTPRWVVAMLVLSTVLAALFLVSAAGSEPKPLSWGAMGSLVIMATPFVVVPLLLLLRPGPLAYGATMMLALMSCAVVLFGLLLMALFGELPTSLSIGFLAAQAALFGWAAARTYRHGFRGLGWAALGASALFFWPLAAYAIGLLVWGGVMGMQVGTLHTRETALVRAVVQAQRCLIERADRGGGFPATLDPLYEGSDACLAETHRELPRGATLDYVPGEPDAAGRITSFELRAAAPGVGEFRPRSVIGDESGLVTRRIRRNEVNAEFRTDGVPRRIGELRQCIAALSEDGAPPRELTPRMAEHLYPQCMSSAIDNVAGENQRKYDERETGFRWIYESDGRTWRVHVRPVVWGETALRSYLFEDRDIHVTLENRPARTTDPGLPPCLHGYIGDCLHTPPDEPPIAVFIHDSIAHEDSSFTLRAGVVGAPHLTPMFLSAGFECNADPAVPVGPFPMDTVVGDPHWGSNPATCYTFRHRPPPLGDRVVIRMWLRKNGAYWAETDTIPYVAAPPRT